MPKRIDEELKARAVRLVNDHRGEYSSLTAAAAVVAKLRGVDPVQSAHRQGVGASLGDPVPGRRGQRAGASTEELAEIKALKARVRRREEGSAILKSATGFFAGELDPRNR